MLEEALCECADIRRERFGQEEIANAGEVLRKLWCVVGPQTFVEWIRRAVVLVQQEEVLLCRLCEYKGRRSKSKESCYVSEDKQETCESCNSKCPMLYLWENGVYRGSPQGQEPNEQFTNELGSFVQKLSCETAPYKTLLCCLRTACEREPALFETLSSLEKEHQTWMGHGVHSSNQTEAGGSTCPSVRAAGFKANQGAKARGIGWSEETACTLSSNVAGLEPTIVYDARGNGDGKIVPTLTGDHQNRVTDYTALCVGNGQMCNITMAPVSNTLDCMHDQQAVLLEGKPPRKYIVRRLTPLECCRLQGFPDNYLDGVDGSDTAKYKLWGNGIALPCAYDVLRKVAADLRA